MFDEDCENDISEVSQEDLFKISLIEILDRIISELQSRFQVLEIIHEKFSFLHGAEIHKIEIKYLKIKAKELAEMFKDDINEEFLQEMESFKYHGLEVNKKRKSAPAATSWDWFTIGFKRGNPNMTTMLRIFLTLPVSVASGERSYWT